MLAFAGPLRGQSLSTGALNGAVRDEAGRLIHQADVLLMDEATGLRRHRLTPRDGRFSFDLLLPAFYDVLVQSFGYQPRLIRRVPVRAGSQVPLDVVLTESAATAGVDTVAYPGAPAGGSNVALHAGGADDDFADLADGARLATGISSLLPGTDGDLSAEGLPGRLGALAADGTPRLGARHPRVASAELEGIAFAKFALRSLEMLPGGLDAEWQGTGGGVLSAFTVPGSQVLRSTMEASGGTDGWNGSLRLSGPLVRDTALFSIGVAAARISPELPAPWLDSVNAAALAGIARDSFLTDLSGYLSPYRPSTTVISATGRLDWLVGGSNLLNVRASAASAKGEELTLGADQPPVIGSSLSARDIAAAASLTSEFLRRFGSEFRISLDLASREYAAAPLAGTVFTAAGAWAGNTALYPGTFKRTTIRFSETVHYRLPIGTLKAGFQAAVATIDQTYADGRPGTFYFGDSTGFATGTGAFRQSVGTLPAVRFGISTLSGFAQGLLRPAPSLSVLVGLRFDRASAPIGDLRLNTQWRTLTGIDNTAVPNRRSQLSPRVQFVWTLGRAQRWEVVGGAGLFLESHDPAEFAEAITHGVGTSIRRGNGALGAWPTPPDSTAAPVQGQALTLLGTQYAPPRTGRVRFGLTGNVGGAILRLQGSYRHTDYLPLRRDLNLPVATGARDQYGRQLHGTLDKFGGVLAAVPGSNRRFAGFDEVSSLDPAAYSDYYGATVGLQRDVMGRISLLLSYTYSRTTDNWFGARSAGVEAQFVPLADSTGRSAWADGRSDFDVPHRLVVGAQLRFGERLRLAALYRWRSGYPFTPGFRDGVDANGDGSARNDPAFVTDTVLDAANVIAANSCLASQVGRLADRNSCRDPSSGALDLRLAFRLGSLRGAPLELLVDAFDVVLSGADVIDHALYLVDPSRPLVSTPATGVTAVPLVANTNFGKALVRRNSDPAFRVGLRVGL